MFWNILQYISSFLFFFLHVQSSSSFPKALSAAEEKHCLEAMAKGDRSARKKLIEHNLRLVAHIAKKYYADENDRDDLVSIGTIGLIKAIDSFRPDKGIKLSSYASRCIENATLSPPTFTQAKASPLGSKAEMAFLTGYACIINETADKLAALCRISVNDPLDDYNRFLYHGQVQALSAHIKDAA